MRTLLDGFTELSGRVFAGGALEFCSRANGPCWRDQKTTRGHDITKDKLDVKDFQSHPAALPAMFIVDFLQKPTKIKNCRESHGAKRHLPIAGQVPQTAAGRVDGLRPLEDDYSGGTARPRSNGFPAPLLQM